jgi:hypothetical protein
MAQQPSAQGIASLFRGNPAPLQQRIQQEQQGKPGLPPDLQKLMALNIVTNEKDAMAKQQALSQLAQMQGPQGKPPTVMESVQEQARQKMEAQALQAQQQQQGLQALMQQAGPGPVPEGTQFAEAQPGAQGIDELPVNFDMAEGGIIAFKKGGDEGEEYETPYDRMNRENREAAERKKREPDKPLDAQAAADRSAIAKLLETLRGGSESAGRAIADVATMVPRGLVGAYDTAVVRPMRAAGVNAAYLSPKLTPEGADPESMTPFTDVARARDAKNEVATTGRTAAENRAAINAADAAVRSAPPAPKPVADLKALAAAQKRQEVTRPPVEEAAPPVAVSSAMPPPQSDADRILAERMMQDPQVAAANKEMMYGSRVGAPDTTQRDAMIKQLQAERDRQSGPKDQWGQLMEYLGQISAAPNGMSSFQAGATGARGVRGLEEQRAQKRFDLGTKIIEQEQGKIDGARAYAKELYGVGEKEFDQIFKAQYEAAKQVSNNETETRKMAQQETLKLLELKQQAELRREEMVKDIRVANIGAAARTSGAGGGADKQQLAELKALQTQYTNQMKTTFNKAERAALQTKLGAVEAAITKMAGLDTMLPAPGAAGPGGTSLKYNPATGKIE